MLLFYVACSFVQFIAPLLFFIVLIQTCFERKAKKRLLNISNLYDQTVYNMQLQQRKERKEKDTEQEIKQ